jgi:hypothetical protein
LGGVMGARVVRPGEQPDVGEVQREGEADHRPEHTAGDGAISASDDFLFIFICFNLFI